ncbi:MAG: hypothetical protein FH751_14790 [Firmicutes bacterium]|nr:hypothetical protein [Bacillota bacterium]
MRIKNKKWLVLLVLIGLTVIGGKTFADPGAEEDPLVTLSYVEKRIEQVKYYIDQKIGDVLTATDENSNEIKEINNQLEEINNNENNTSKGSSLTVIQLKEGQKLICNKGTEIIVRSGKVSAITSELGGLSDITSAKDLKMNENVEKNHLIIIPRDDGRGVLAIKNSYIMVTGGYEIK